MKRSMELGEDTFDYEVCASSEEEESQTGLPTPKVCTGCFSEKAQTMRLCVLRDGHCNCCEKCRVACGSPTPTRRRLEL